jgi:type III pantothenate kinase
MILCIDVGNSNIYGGVFNAGEIQMRFRYPSKSGATSDQLGVFFKSVLRENDVDASLIKHIAICSVVPDLDYSLRSACRKYFGQDPFFLQAGVKTGLKIKYRNPIEVGADRISTAMAAVSLYPQQNLIIVDLGTATVFCAVTADKDYLGGAILPGMRVSMLSLQSSTAKLPPVEIVRPQAVIGRSAVESIQSGLYYSHLGGLREIIGRIQREHFPDSPPKVLGTGGFSHLFEKEDIFTAVIPDLVLIGLQQALQMNTAA